MPQIEVRCPVCPKKGSFKIQEETIVDFSRGLLAVNIPNGTICEHTFIAYIDRNLEIRDYFMADFKIELPIISLSREEKKKAQRITSEHILDVDLIKLNLHSMLLTYILKSIISKKKAVLISDLEFLHDHIHNFFKYITKNSFDTNISIITEKDYKGNKKKYKDAMMFRDADIIRNVDKTIDPKRLKVEKQIVHNFVSESDLGYSYIRLKNDVQKSYEFCKEVMKLLEDYKKSGGKEKIGKKMLIYMLAEKTNIKLSIPYMEFLLDIIKNYFEFDLSLTSDCIFPALGI